MADQDAEGLQFDNAEYDTPAAGAPTCAACKKPIPNAYYELFGAIVCDSCKDMIVASREGGSKSPDSSARQLSAQGPRSPGSAFISV